jgi:hypothetical protein
MAKDHTTITSHPGGSVPNKCILLTALPMTLQLSADQSSIVSLVSMFAGENKYYKHDK